MSRDPNAPLPPAAARRLRAVAPKGRALYAPVPLAVTMVGGRVPPRAECDVRPVEPPRAGASAAAWQVVMTTTRYTGLDLPRFPRVRRRPRVPDRPEKRRDPLGADAGHVNDAFRPRFIAFASAPNILPPAKPLPVLRHRGKPIAPLVSNRAGDDRRTYRDARYPWGCACRVISGARGGSGVLVGPRHVLTAAHAIDWDAPCDVIEVHRFDNALLAASTSSAVWALPGAGGRGRLEVAADYAVIVTSFRLGDWFGWMGSRTYDPAWDRRPWWQSVGYAAERGGGRRPTLARDLELDADAPGAGSARALRCACAFTAGASGSPVFTFWPDGNPYVVAVISGRGEGGDTWCAGGAPLTGLVRAARAGEP